MKQELRHPLRTLGIANLEALAIGLDCPPEPGSDHWAPGTPVTGNS
jgi:hypothetical protein